MKMPKLLDVVIKTVNSELRFSIDSKALGRELFDQVTRTLGIREVWYFGLYYVDCKGFMAWLKDDKKLIEQDLPKESPVVFQFKIMFYPEDVVNELIQEVTQHLFFLEVKEKILKQEIFCPSETSVMMAAYVAQAQFGEYDERVHKTGCLSIDTLIPQKVLEQFNMTSEMWEKAIVQCWNEPNCQISKIESEVEYLKLAQDLEMYGITYFEIKNKKGTDLVLGVDAHGINIYEPNDVKKPKITFPWNEVQNVAYNDKKFVIKPLEKKSPDFTVYVPKVRISKLILQLSMGNHERFIKRRQDDSMAVQQMKIQAAEERTRRQLEREKLDKEIEARIAVEEERDQLKKRLVELEEIVKKLSITLQEKDGYITALEKNVAMAEKQVQKAKEDLRRVHQQQQMPHMSEEDKRRVDQESLARTNVFSPDKKHFIPETWHYQLDEARNAEQKAKMRFMELTSTSHSPPLTHDQPTLPDYSETAAAPMRLPADAINRMGYRSAVHSANDVATPNSYPPHHQHLHQPYHMQPQLTMPPVTSSMTSGYPPQSHTMPPSYYQTNGNAVPVTTTTLQDTRPYTSSYNHTNTPMASSSNRSRYMSQELDAIRARMEDYKVEDNRLSSNETLGEENILTNLDSAEARISFFEKL